MTDDTCTHVDHTIALQTVISDTKIIPRRGFLAKMRSRSVGLTVVLLLLLLLGAGLL